MKIRYFLTAVLLAVSAVLGFMVYQLEMEKSARERDQYTKEKLEHCTYELNVTYAESESGLCTMDVIWDERAGTAPLVVLLHGGAWIGGEKEEVRSMQLALAADGYTIANVNYDLAPNVTIVQQEAQIEAALQYLMDNAAHYKINTSKVVLAGFSAGAHLAVLTAQLMTEKESDIKISCCIDICGPTALRYYVQNVDNEVSQMFLNHPEIIGGEESNNVLNEIQRIDPASHVSENMPPVLIVQGAADPIVPQEISEYFDQVLQEHSVDSDYVVIQGMVHEFDIARLYEPVTTFLIRNLGFRGK
ncbi:MAG: alpha/beta hydrolase [Lachnospiraceae bacterium]|nr:alpha/beta hydrolase [Lachnospiraceae bacterium]